MFSKKYLFLINISVLFLLFGCNPIKEKAPEKALVELEFIDPELAKQQNSDEQNHAVSANLSLEIQEDATTGKKTLSANVVFHEATEKNILFDNIPTKALSKNLYKPKPKPDEPSCGIPGFPDCPTPKPDPQPPVDGICGIPGYPDCPPAKTPTIPANPAPQPTPQPEPTPKPIPQPPPPSDICGIPGYPDCPVVKSESN